MFSERISGGRRFRGIVAKTEMNAFDVAAIVREVDIVGARVDKVYQPGLGEVVLRLRRSAAEGGKIDLAMSPGFYFFPTTVPRTNPQQLPGFAAALRRHIGGGLVRGIRQHGFDRIIEIAIDRGEGQFRFIVELFRDGNAVLVRDGKILATIVTQTFASRVVRAGSNYEFPPERIDPRALTAATMETRLAASTVDIVRALAVELNLGGTYAEEILGRARVPKNAPASSLPRPDVERIFAALQDILRRLDAGELDPVVVRRDGAMVDVAPVPLLAHEGADVEHAPSFGEALDSYFSKPPTEVVHDAHADRAKEATDKHRRKLAQQLAAIDRFKAEESEARARGDLLYAHFASVAEALKYLAQSTRDIGWKETEDQLPKKPFAAIVSKLHPHEGAATLALPNETGAPVKVRVDIRKSVQENAEDSYARSKKLREKRAGAEVAIDATRREIREAEKAGARLAEARSEAQAAAKIEPTRRFSFESFRWFITSDGNLVVGGRDAGSNERVVKKYLLENDRYVHADLHGAPSLVVKAAGHEPPSERSLEEAAAFAVAMSKAWSTGHASGQAYWVLPSQVSRTPGSGEFVARGAFIIRGKRNLVRVEVRLGVGEIEYEGARKIMCGPQSAVAARSKRYLTIVPGREEKNAFARKASALFRVPNEEILSILPPGDVEAQAGVGLSDEERDAILAAGAGHERKRRA
jgi:predicted ribosome quality control (RQC) complex YloA/Tae2 family protein